MKKRILMLLLTLGLVASLTGCGGEEKPTLKSQRDSVEELEVESEKEDEETKEETEETEEPEVDEKEEKKEEEKEESKKKSGAVLGGNPDDFKGFEYLYAESLRTESEENEETGEMESKELVVMIPKDDYAYIDRTYASVESLGVDFKVSLNPYFQYEQEDYLLSENLQVYLEDEYDAFYSTDYKDLVVSEVEELSEEKVFASASYVIYDEWDEMYIPVYKVFYANELEKDLTVLVEIEINLAETTGKTQKLLDELESFYEIEIGWDKAAMEEKVADFVANNDGDTETVSTGYMMFELPKGWEVDYDFNENYSAYTYAPGGDGALAECAISIEREYAYDEDYVVEAFLADPEAFKEMFLAEMDENLYNVEVSDEGETVLGRTMKLTLDAEEEGVVVHYAFYFASADSYMYSISVVQTDNAAEDAFAVAEQILATAQLRD